MALYESLFNLSESLLPEYSAFGAVRQPAGGALPGIAPSMPTLRQRRVRAGGGQRRRHLQAPDARYRPPGLAEDPALARNDGRVQRVDEIDAAIAAWTRTQTVEAALAVLRAAEVPSGRIYTVKDIAEDPHYRARGVIEQVTSAGGLSVEVPGIMPKLSASGCDPGARAPARRAHRHGAGAGRLRRRHHCRPACTWVIA